MKLIKYIFLTLVAVIIILTIVCVVFKMKSKIVTSTPAPVATNSPLPMYNFTLDVAPSESLRGQITAMKGNIDWLGRTATEAAKISAPITIQQGENLITENGSGLSLDFPNACTLNFSEKTEVDIIQTLPANVVFTQVTGTAEYLKTGSYPIDIRTLSLLTELDGDANISINPKTPTITLILKSGKAIIAFNDLHYISHEVTISAGHTYTFNSRTRKGVVETISKLR